MDEYTYLVNVDGVVVRDDEYFLIERGADEDHASGLLAFPGGKVEQPPVGEDTIETTVTRELYEEVGVEVETVDYVLSTTFETDDGSSVSISSRSANMRPAMLTPERATRSQQFTGCPMTKSRRERTSPRSPNDSPNR